MWCPPHRDDSALFEKSKKIFLCILPPEEFYKHGYKGPDSLIQEMKDVCCSARFDKLNRHSFRNDDADGHHKLPQYEGEQWQDFLKLDGSRVLGQHIRTLAHEIHESIPETFKMFWQYRVDEAARADAHRTIAYFLHRSSVDKVRASLCCILMF